VTLSSTSKLRMTRARNGRAGRRSTLACTLTICPAVLCLLTVLASVPSFAQASFRPTAFEDVDFVSSNVGWAVGSPGAVYTTVDGGQTWAQRPYGGTDWLTGVDFVSSTVGWIIGTVNEGEPAIIMHSMDGGRHWVNQANPTTTDVFTDVKFANATTGCIVGRYGTILRTTNGGDTWTQVASGTTRGLSALVMRRSGVGYAVGASGLVLKSTDFGATWVTLTRKTSRDLRAASFASDKKGWIVGAHGLILKTVNGGGTWVTQTSRTTQALAGVDFIDGLRGWAVGAKGVIVRTTNGGTTWVRRASGTAAFLFAVDFRSGHKGWVVGELDRPPGSTPWAYGVIYRTVNAGIRWARQL
jgi:photosystem II stability/assembly factor-like uncharacterized protein